jgi:hypothetical protein
VRKQELKGVLTSRMNTTAVARILSCTHSVDIEKNAEMHKSMFFKSPKMVVICGNVKRIRIVRDIYWLTNRGTRCVLTSVWNMKVQSMELKLIIVDCHVIRYATFQHHAFM